MKNSKKVIGELLKNSQLAATENNEEARALVIHDSDKNTASRDLVPFSSKALSSLVPQEESAQEITVTPVDVPKLFRLIPDQEQEVADEKASQDDAKIRELGFFSPVKGMAHIINAQNNKLYARIYEDKDGVRYVEFIQEYSDDTFSVIMRIPQECILIAVAYKFEIKNIKDNTGLRNMLGKYIMEAYREYYGKFRGPAADRMNIIDILNTLCEAMEHLPVHSVMRMKRTGEEFYRYLVEQLWSLSRAISFFDYKAYFPLDNEGMRELAYLMGMSKDELLDKLVEEGLLYLTPSSKGYQTNVRIKYPDGQSHTQWMYCIFKLSYFAGLKEKKEPDILGML